jgi:hypothetical protein
VRPAAGRQSLSLSIEVAKSEIDEGKFVAFDDDIFRFDIPVRDAAVP